MFWKRIQSLCEENNTTPTAMAKMLNLSTSMVTRWKEGGEPTPRILIKLAEHFGVTTDYLLGASDIKRFDCNTAFIEMWSETPQSVINAIKSLKTISAQLAKIADELEKTLM